MRAITERLSHGDAVLPGAQARSRARSKVRAAAAAVLLLMLALTADAARGQVEVVDDEGRTVRLVRPAMRIVSLAPHVTEQLFAVGAGSRIVGAVAYSDYPPEAKRIPRVGDSGAIDFERLLAMRPDLVVAWTSGNSPKQIEQLRSLGLPVYSSQPRRLEDVATSLERLGRLAGTWAIGAQAARSFREQIRILRERYGTREPVTVFLELWNRPLYTVNNEQLISDAIRLCGGSNVFGDLQALAPAVTHEAVLKADPAAVVATGMGGVRPEWLDEWRAWPQMQAARLGNLFVIDSDLMNRHGPRLAEGARQLCELLELARTRRAQAPASPRSPR